MRLCMNVCVPVFVKENASREKGECHKKAIENVSTIRNVIGAFSYHPFF